MINDDFFFLSQHAFEQGRLFPVLEIAGFQIRPVRRRSPRYILIDHPNQFLWSTQIWGDRLFWLRLMLIRHPGICDDFNSVYQMCIGFVCQFCHFFFPVSVRRLFTCTWDNLANKFCIAMFLFLESIHLYLSSLFKITWFLINSIDKGIEGLTHAETTHCDRNDRSIYLTHDMF